MEIDRRAKVKKVIEMLKKSTELSPAERERKINRAEKLLENEDDLNDFFEKAFGE